MGTKLTPQQLDDGWIRLFDGSTLCGWQGSGWKPGNKGNLISAGGRIRTTIRFGESAIRLRVKKAIGSKGSVHLGCTESGECQAVVPFAGSGEIWEWTEAQAKPGYLQLSVESGEVEVAEVLLQPLSMRPVKEWRRANGGETIFSVSQSGRIHMEGGPGEYISREGFRDFVLQFAAEIHTMRSSPELHGGVFIRGFEGKNFSGIKVVLDNRFRDKDPQKPLDFGTGGLYGKQAAREIFTRNRAPMRVTVVADGRHVSTWVEGYQQTDWMGDETEIRPEGVIGLDAADPLSNFTFTAIRASSIGKP